MATSSVAEAPARRMPIEVGLMVMGRETGAPWIEVSVNGVKTKAILDTGAEFHVVQTWFADEAKIGSDGDQDVDVTDSSKKSVKASFARVRGRVEGWGPLDTPAVLMPTFAAFETAGVGMIVNPLLLAAPGKALRLDFVAREMSELDALTEPAPSTVLQTCASVSRLKNGTVITTNRQVTEVEIAGSTTALTVDSGARTTVIAAGSDATEELVKLATGTETAAGVLGTEEVKTIAEPVPITVAGVTLKVSGIRLGPEEKKRTSCNDDGVLGMDVLEHCVVELSITDTRLTCRAPG
ncbi:MAG: aspartyl protease family protein [Polyangiaceae bacterium]